MLARTLSRLDDAARHFEDALQIQRGMPILLARTRCEYAGVLALRAALGDRERALDLLGQAIEGAGTYGMRKVAADAIALKLELEGVASVDPGSSIELVASSIESKRPDLRPAAAPDGTVTLLFSDMEGFTEMTERLGDAEAHRLMLAHHEIIRRELRAHGGREIEVQGDGFLLAFPKATEALRYAVVVQRAFAAYRQQHPEEPIHVRIGLHTGEPIKEGERFFGKTVILAARISAHARGDEILLSSLVHDLTESSGEFGFDEGEELTLKGLSGTHRVYALTWDPQVPARRARVVASPAAAENAFRREGDYWSIAYGGRSIRMRDAKGLQYMSVLLRRPGEEIHVADLTNGAEAGATVARTGAAELSVSAGLGDAGEVLDGKARSEYRARLEDLRAELDEARAMNDVGRTERIEQEIEFLSQELSSAYGLGGRARRSADSVERARKAVSSRVLDSISRIRKENPDLGVHLAHSIRLGLFCRYAPDKPVEWSV